MNEMLDLWKVVPGDVIARDNMIHVFDSDVPILVITVVREHGVKGSISLRILGLYMTKCGGPVFDSVIIDSFDALDYRNVSMRSNV